MRELLIIFIFLISLPACSHQHPENNYQSLWCITHHGITEYRLNDKTRVDCLTKNYAIEFDFAPKWAESIGQSLYYAKMTGRKPAVVLIIENPKDYKYYHRINKIAKDLNISVWYIKKSDYETKCKELAGVCTP